MNTIRIFQTIIDLNILPISLFFIVSFPIRKKLLATRLTLEEFKKHRQLTIFIFFIIPILLKLIHLSVLKNIFRYSGNIIPLFLYSFNDFSFISIAVNILVEFPFIVTYSIAKPVQATKRLNNLLIALAITCVLKLAILLTMIFL
jgi:hypothetical protein